MAENKIQTPAAVADGPEAEVNSVTETTPAKGTEKKAVDKKKTKSGKNFFKKIGKFFKDTNSERKKVVWTSKKTTVQETLLVVVAVVIFAVVIGALDLLFSEAIKALGGLINLY